MPARKIENLLTEHRKERRGGTPHESWVSRNRDLLMKEIARDSAPETTTAFGDKVSHLFDVFMPLETVMVAGRGFAIFLVMIGTVLTGGLATAQVYADAMPGEMFYSVKVAVERAQLALAPTAEYRAHLHTEFADRRIEEIARIAESPEAASEHLADALVAFDAEVRSLESSLVALKAAGDDDVAVLAKVMDRKIAGYRSTLASVARVLPTDLRIAVASTRHSIDSAGLAAIAVLVDKHLEGDTNAPRTVVVSKFEERLRVAESALPAVPTTEGAVESSKTVRAKAAIAEAKTLIEEQEYRAALIKIAEVAELTADDGDAEAEGETTEDDAVSEEDAEDDADDDTEESEPQTPATEEKTDPATADAP